MCYIIQCRWNVGSAICSLRWNLPVSHKAPVSLKDLQCRPHLQHLHLPPAARCFFVMWVVASVPSKLKKTALSALFLDASRQKFWKLALANLDAISSTVENFTKQNFVIFWKMCATYFHDLSRSQVTTWMYSSERWKKFRRSLEIICLQVYKKVLGIILRFMCP